MRPELQEAFNRFQNTSNRFLDLLAQEADGPSYRATAADEDDLFDDIEDAIQRSQELGLDGNVHQMDDGRFCPGESHAAYEAAIDDSDSGGDGGDTDDDDDDDDQDTDDAQASTTDPDGGDADGPIDDQLGGDGSQVLTAQATGTVSVQAGQDTVDMAADGDDGLFGIVWGAGNHDLALGGEPAGVHVPAETVPDTYQALTDDVAAGDVTIGVDHPDDDSVLAQTGLVDIGVANDVALTADERNIVLTDSEMTNEDAQAALEAGAFDDFDFSVVADVAVRTDDAGDRVTTDDGRYVIDATRIQRLDVVTNGAVDAASIVRDTDDLPDLADATAQVRRVADDPNQNPTVAVDALEASATALTDYISSSDMTNTDIDPDVDDLDDAKDQLSAAASIIDDLSDEKEQMEAKANAFADVAEAQDIDLDDFDDDAEAAQAVIDQTTVDLRREIADLEAGLPDFDTTEDDVDDRVDALAGSSPEELRAKRGDLAYQSLQAQQREQDIGSAVAAGDATGATAGLSGSGNGNEDSDEIALDAMDGSDRIRAKKNGLSPTEYVREQYGVEASQFDSADSLHAEIMQAEAGDGGGN